MYKKRPGLLLLMVLTLLLGHMAPATAAQAAFSFDPETGTILKYNGTSEEVVVPDAIDGVPVLRIGMSAFEANQHVTKVTLPKGLTRIETNAFYFCENLNTISLPEGLQVMGDYAFFNCTSLDELTIPAAVVYIGNHSLAFCAGLNTLSFLGEAPVFGPNALDNGPESRQITVPKEALDTYEKALNTTCLSGSPLVKVNHLAGEELIGFDAQSGYLTSFSGQDAYYVLPDTIQGVQVVGIKERAFFANDSLLRLDLPEGLTTLSDQAFANSGLVHVGLPQSLVHIGDKAFSGTKLFGVALPSSLTTLGEGAFSYTHLRSLTLPDSLSNIPKEAFLNNIFLEDATFPAGLPAIGEAAFKGCSALSYLVFLGKELPSLAADAFLNCPLEDVDIAWDASLKQANQAAEAFASLGFTSEHLIVWRANPPMQPPYPANAKMTFDEHTAAVTSYEGDLEAMTMWWDFYTGNGQEKRSVKKLGDHLFENSNLKTFYVPHSGQLTEIGAYAFANSQLEDIYLFDSVTTIGPFAFKDCSQLKTLVLPESIKEIGEGALMNCAALNSVVFLGGEVHIAKDAFSGCDQLTQLVLPQKAKIDGEIALSPASISVVDSASKEELSALSAQLNLPWYWELGRQNEPSRFVNMPEDLVRNAEDDFEFDEQEGRITKYIGSKADIVVPESIRGIPVRSLGFLSFSDATVSSYLAGTAENKGIKSIVLPQSLRVIEDSAFLSCAALESIVCYGPLDRLGNRAFENCTALTSAVFHNGVREVDIGCFNLASALLEIQLGDKVLTIGDDAFYGTGLKGLLTLTAATIGQRAYMNNQAVTQIHVTAPVNSIGAGAFQGMEHLQKIWFDRADPAILGAGNFQFDQTLTDLKLCLPSNASEEEVAAFVSLLNQNLLPGKDMVILEDYAP